MKIWASEFKHGPTSLADNEHSGQPTTATVTDRIEKIHQIVLDDWQIMMREITEAVGISKGRVYYIFYEELHLRKLSARWVP